MRSAAKALGFEASWRLEPLLPHYVHSSVLSLFLTTLEIVGGDSEGEGGLLHGSPSPRQSLLGSGPLVPAFRAHGCHLSSLDSLKPGRVTWGLPEVRTCTQALVLLALCGVGLLRLEITGITEALALFRRVSLTFSGQQ